MTLADRKLPYATRSRVRLLSGKSAPLLGGPLGDRAPMNPSAMEAGHRQGGLVLQTGNESFVRPSVGVWITYSQGSAGGAAKYGSAFLTAADGHSGTVDRDIMI